MAELLIHPFVLPFFLVPAWFKSLWNSRVLLYGKWGRYHGFRARNAISYFFYKTQWVNFEKYGRCGKSPSVGLGDYPLSKWFHLTMLSSCLYANAGAVVTLGGTLLWVFSHLVWVSAAPWQWTGLLTLLLFFSSTAYAMAFVRQNYNILGWMWLPVGLYAIATHQYALAAIMWLLASFASFTAVVTMAIMLFFMMLFEGDPYIGLTVVPAVIKLFFHLLPLFHTGGLRSALLNMAKLIGLTSNKGVKYKRSSMKASINTAYFISLYGLACALFWIGTGVFPKYLLLCLLFYCANQLKLRFADEESLYMLLTSIGMFSIMQNQANLFSVCSALVLINPHPLLFGISDVQKHGRLRIMQENPFDHTSLLSEIEQFLSPIEDGGRVLFVFDDPKDNYDRVFDGYRNLIELPLFMGCIREILVFPSWYYIAETNFHNAPVCWGRDIDKVVRNTIEWHSPFAIVYTHNDEQFDFEAWGKHFDLEGTFDWEPWKDSFAGYEPWEKEKGAPKWWLLRRRL